jgi:tetratricopeptide (TPR) repeat protein
MYVRRLILLVLLVSSGHLAVGQPQEISTVRKSCGPFTYCLDAVSTNVSIRDAAAPGRAIDELKKGFMEDVKKLPANAEKHFRKALEIYPEFDSAIAGLAESLSEQGSWEEAEHLSFTALQRAPNHPSLLRVEASISQHEKKFAESVPLLKRALALEPHSESALVLLARAELMAGDCGKALTHAQQAHVERPHINAIAHVISAVCLERLQEFANARQEYELFLQEEHHGEGAELARKRLNALKGADAGAK